MDSVRWLFSLCCSIMYCNGRGHRCALGAWKNKSTVCLSVNTYIFICLSVCLSVCLSQYDIMLTVTRTNLLLFVRINQICLSAV